MTTQIELKSMKFYAYHGVMEQERRVGNHFLVDLLVTVPIQKATESDDLSDTINYAELFDVVKKEMAIPSNLLEHVAGRILTSLKTRFPAIESIELKLSKLTPPFGGDVYSAAVILKENFL
ncbi:dihydroneopterin aldolase [Parabacteroides sp. OttesenSCG-928-G06]|nr:dihydroneopterin aldolase [Parabacteroides sp. OttesenSCG-928-G06]